MSESLLASFDSSQPDEKEARRYLEFLSGGNPAKEFTFATLDEANSHEERGKSITLHGTLEEHFDKLAAYNGQGFGVFVVLNRTDGHGRKKENIVDTRGIAIADFDRSPLDPALKGPYPPQLVVETSPGRYHALFSLTELPLDRFTDIQKALAERLGSDLVVKDVTRLFRIPGFLHHKGESTYLSHISQTLDRSPHDLQAFMQWLNIESECTFSPDSSQSKDPQSERHVIREGNRNSTLTRTGGSLRRIGLQVDVIDAALQVFNRQRCVPPLPEAEVRRIAKSVERYPVPGEKAARPELSAGALYGLAGDIAREVASRSEADPAAVLASALVRAGATFGPELVLPVGDTSHFPRLFVIKVGATSRGRKGTSEDSVRRVFEAAENELNEPLIQNGVVNLDARMFSRLSVRPGPMSSGEGLIYAVRDPSEVLDKEGKVIERDEGVTDKRLLIIESEFGAPLRTAQRHGSILSTTIRSAWDHGNLAPLTKNSRITATDAHICVIGHITAEELDGLLQEVDIWNGFANRFLFLYVERKKLVPWPEPLPDAIVRNFAERLASTVLTASRRKTKITTLDAEAKRIWTELYADLSQDWPGPYGAVTSRAETQVLRIALVYALLDGDSAIRSAHLEAAVAFWQFCDESARYIFSGLGSGRHETNVLAALATGPKSQGEFYGELGGHVKAYQLNKVLARLETEGIIQHSIQATGGRPAKIWRLIQSP